MYILKPNDTFSRSAKKKRDHIDSAIGSHMKVAFVAISAAPCLKQVGRDLKELLENGFRATTVRNVGVAQH
jgi:hypothetical protein